MHEAGATNKVQPESWKCVCLLHDAGATNKVQPESWGCVCLMHDACSFLFSDLAGWDSPLSHVLRQKISWIQLFNVNWVLGRLFHWSTGSLVN